MKSLLLSLLAFVVFSAPAIAADDKKPLKSFHVNPPAYSVPSAVKHAQKRKDRGIVWYHRHFADQKLK